MREEKREKNKIRKPVRRRFSTYRI